MLTHLFREQVFPVAILPHRVTRSSACLKDRGERDWVSGQIVCNRSKSRLDWVPKFWSRFQHFGSWSQNRSGSVLEPGNQCFWGHFYYLILNRPEPWIWCWRGDWEASKWGRKDQEFGTTGDLRSAKQRRAEEEEEAAN